MPAASPSPTWQRKAVLKNNVAVGSANADRRHWYKAGEALARADRAWLSQFVTRRERPENLANALQRSLDDIKVSFNSPTHELCPGAKPSRDGVGRESV